MTISTPGSQLIIAHARADAVAADEEIGALALSAGEVHEHARAILLDALEGVAEVIACLRDRRPHEPLQPVPRGEDLRQMLFRDHPAIAVKRDAFVHLDAKITGPGAALLQRLQQFGVGGDAGAAAD